MNRENMEKARNAIIRRFVAMQLLLRRQLQDSKGQGTTEYAILVGVIVVIAIVAIIAFRSKLEALWESITSAVNSL